MSATVHGRRDSSSSTSAATATPPPAEAGRSAITSARGVNSAASSSSVAPSTGATEDSAGGRTAVFSWIRSGAMRAARSASARTSATVIGQAGEQHDLQPDLSRVALAERDHPFDQAGQPQGRVRPVHLLEQSLVGSVQRGQHDVRRRQPAANRRAAEERAVGDHGHGDVRDRLDPVDDGADPGVERRFARSRECDDVGIGRQPVAHLGDHGVRVCPALPAPDRLAGRPPELAVDAVVGARLERDEVDAE